MRRYQKIISDKARDNQTKYNDLKALIQKDTDAILKANGVIIFVLGIIYPSNIFIISIFRKTHIFLSS